MYDKDESNLVLVKDADLEVDFILHLYETYRLPTTPHLYFGPRVSLFYKDLPFVNRRVVAGVSPAHCPISSHHNPGVCRIS